MRLRSIPSIFRLGFCGAAFLISIAVDSTLAEISVPKIISDHMVLQQGEGAQLWGWAEPQEKITAELLSGTQAIQSATTTAGDDRKWKLSFKELKAGGSYDLVLRGSNTIVVKDVMVGEVWLASGQSNMEWDVNNSLNGREEIAQARYPEIRIFTVKRAASVKPQEDCTGKWERCDPSVAAHFTGVGYFFSRSLHRELKVPIGLIHSSFGGSHAEWWTPIPALAAVPELAPIVESWNKDRENYPAAKAEYDRRLAAWKEEEQKALTAGQPAPPKPPLPRGSGWPSPACLFHAMIEPIASYTFRGIIWYQGEANTPKAAEYRLLFATLIKAWRETFGGGDLPFYYVQLANFQPRKTEPAESAWAELREAQRLTLDQPATGMAVAIDIGDENNIHPKNKQEVGARLSRIALAKTYGRDIEDSGPLPSGFEVRGGEVHIRFSHAKDGLITRDGRAPQGFALADATGKFAWASARIEGDTVIISNPSIVKPEKVRYAWADSPDCNLTNRDDLPASPFQMSLTP